MIFDPLVFTRHDPLAPDSALRRWLRRLCIFAVLAISGTAALLLFAPLL